MTCFIFFCFLRSALSFFACIFSRLVFLNSLRLNLFKLSLTLFFALARKLCSADQGPVLCDVMAPFRECMPPDSSHMPLSSAAVGFLYVFGFARFSPFNRINSGPGRLKVNFLPPRMTCTVLAFCGGLNAFAISSKNSNPFFEDMLRKHFSNNCFTSLNRYAEAVMFLLLSCGSSQMINGRGPNGFGATSTEPTEQVPVGREAAIAVVS